jgi:glutamine cyclotransferase
MNTRRRLRLLCWLTLVCCSTAVAGDAPPVHGYRVVARFPHDADAFTQGLVWADGRLYESTGLRGRSALREIDLTTGRVIRSAALSRWQFGEGLAAVGDRLIQLTWHAGEALVRDRETLQKRGILHYAGEGWGLAWDGRRLVMSDGSATLVFRDPDSFAELGRVQVTAAGTPVSGLNELEVIRGEIWANVWGSERIARIDPDSGRVNAWVDLGGLRPQPTPGKPIDVLNGIAWDDQKKRLFVTGKLWPWLYQIRVIES